MPSLVLGSGSLAFASADVAELKAGRLPHQMFFDAVVARVERNQNADEFSETHLREVAATLAHTPIDDEHHMKVVQGSFLESSYDPTARHPITGALGALKARVVTWPARFPEVAMGLLEGKVKLSIESIAQEVECSACQKRFPTTAGEDAYCSCLQARRATGTSRLWHGNRGIGAAFTTNPAGTGCEVLPGTVALLASYDPTLDTTPPPKENRKPPMELDTIKALVAAALAAVEKGEETVATADTDDAKALVASVMGGARAILDATKVAALTDKTTALEAAKTAADKERDEAVAKAKSDGEALLATEKRVFALKTLAKAVPDAEASRPLVASMSEPQWDAYLAQCAATEKALTASATPPVPAQAATEPRVGEATLRASARETAPTPGATGDQTAATTTSAAIPPAPRRLDEFKLTFKRA